MSKNKVKVPNIVRGGIAIPLGRNYYYMRGRKHEDGGIDIGENPRTGLEVEDGEVMHMGDKETTVYSAQKFLGGVSPAERVMRGENPERVFKAQEDFKRRNNINDDGTKKKRNGGRDISYIYDRVNRKNTPDFIRMRNPNRKSIPDWEKEGYISTNKLSIGTDENGQDYLYNDIQDDGNGGLIDMSNPNNYKNGRYMGAVRAEERGDTVHINSIADGLQFSKEYKDYYPGFRRTKRNGGLSRSKDYGSSKKPYPKVKNKDFAGGHRSYPIPTKADARDALRLAGLHGRSDVKAKVYRKYPELRKKARNGSVFTLEANGKSKLMMIPSTGDLKQSKTTKTTNTAKYGKRKKISDGIQIDTLPSWIIPTQEEILARNQDYFIKEPIVPIRLRDTIRRATSPTAIIGNTDASNTIRKITSSITPNTTINLPSFSTITTIRRTNNKANRVNRANNVGDWIGLGSNITSGLIGNIINRNMLNDLEYSSAPIPRVAPKLKTRININPQLDNMRESLAAYERNVANNTGSSQVALSRQQRARLANIIGTNSIYANKENTETQLINADKLNQQEVANKNIEDYNTWAQNKAIFDNTIREQQAENNIGLIDTINSGIQNMISNRQQRRAYNQTNAAMLFASPNLPVEMLYAQGLITKETRDAYRRAYPLNS